MRMINADALLTEIQKKEAEPNYQHTGEDWCVGLIIAEGLVDDQPTIESQKWIPFTPETMPEEAGAYLCTCKDAGRLIITLIKWQPRMKSWNLTGARTYWKVIAWMPLPDPWKGEEE